VPTSVPTSVPVPSTYPSWTPTSAPTYVPTSHADFPPFFINEFEPEPVDLPEKVSIELRRLRATTTEAKGVLLIIDGGPGKNAGHVDRIEPIDLKFEKHEVILEIEKIKPPPFTMVLLESFTGDEKTDTDEDNDGDPEKTGTFGRVYDALGVKDTCSQGFVYGKALGLRPKFANDFDKTPTSPELVFRDRISEKWFAVDGDPENKETLHDTANKKFPKGKFDGDNPQEPTFSYENPTGTL